MADTAKTKKSVIAKSANVKKEKSVHVIMETAQEVAVINMKDTPKKRNNFFSFVE